MMIRDCYAKQDRDYPQVSEETLRNSLALIDEYTDVVVETFLSYGLQDNYEPNKYGLDLEEVKEYLLKMRYAIVG